MTFHQHELIYIKLLLSEHQPENIFEFIQNGICVTDIHSKIIYTNPAFSRIAGYSAEELLGQNPGMLHSGRHTKHFYEEMWTAINTKGYWEGEIWNRRKSGEIYPEYLTISTFTDHDKNVSYYIGIVSDISYLKKDIYKKLKLSFYDPLTELPNRTLYHDRVSLSLNVGKTHPDMKHAILFMDLDKFKQVNDTYGHLAGDHLLKAVGERLSSVVRAGDTVARVGGDEFTAIFHDIKDKESAANLAKRMVEKIEEPFEIDGHKVNISISIGICLYPGDAHHVDSLLARADKAMYKAKKNQSRIEFYNEADYQD